MLLGVGSRFAVRLPTNPGDRRKKGVEGGKSIASAQQMFYRIEDRGLVSIK